ncbi:cadherin-like protein 26 [Salminus brasiliensis]|uniref:cadherin-like protein 26 n=1 Tax=Salminus brasiliensis TaxID=930266 RepID=UPI003B83A471
MVNQVWTADAGWIVDFYPMNFTLEEEYSGALPHTLAQLNMEKESLLGCTASGPGIDKEPVGVFHIDKNRALIEVNEKVDYEEYKNFMLRLDCFSSDNVHTRLGVEIQVLDINDNVPEFDQEKYETSVKESTPQGTDLLTVRAVDQDDIGTRNGLFTFTITSVSPPTSNLDFFIQQQSNTGRISFRGCLDYEEAQSYTILVEAKDHGESVQLSSTATVIVNIIDNNDHKPELSVRPGGGRVKERESGVVVYRLEVNDKDHQGSAGWRAKYSLHGEKEENFRIETEPTTNHGILSVIAPLDFEESPKLTLSVSVENEEPLFSCAVKQRRDGGLWDVSYFRESSGSALLSFPITITVEDVNDPPELTPTVKHVSIMENTAAGHSLWMFTATDHDSHNSPANIRFLKGEDVDNWVTVNETGHVSTVKALDRESPFVKDNTYTVTVLAVDQGEPPMTATGTLVIHVLDKNDNLPMLEVNTLEMCFSDEPTMTNITAVDLDLPPFSSPFTYELRGDVKGKWRIEPSFGSTVSLVKEGGVFSGQHELKVRVQDSQGRSSVQSLTVSVYDCSITFSSRSEKRPSARLSAIALTIIITALLLGILLVTFSLSCLNRKTLMREMQSSEGSLLHYNTEMPGTDCENYDQMLWSTLPDLMKFERGICKE